jgi:hypothetical protein
MNLRRLFVYVVIGILMLGVSLWAQDCTSGICTSTVAYTGQFFDTAIPTNFCAAVRSGSPVRGASLYFVGQEVCTGQQYTAGFGFGGGTSGPIPLVTTGGTGQGCAYATWPCGVYAVQAIAGAVGDYPGDTSCPAAVTIVAQNTSGIFAGGKLPLSTFVDSRGFTVSATQRCAGFGFIYQTPHCCYNVGPCTTTTKKIQLETARRAELLLVDPKACTQITACNFNVWVEVPCQGNAVAPGAIEGVLASGYCQFTQNGSTTTAKFELYLEAAPIWAPQHQVSIKVFKLPTRLLYQACGDIQNGGTLFKLSPCFPPPPG